MDHPVAIITGAGGGIGRAIAVELSRWGYALVLVGRTEATLRETLASVAADETMGLVVAADVSRPESADEIVRQTLTAFGRIDVLINNAGWAPVKSIEETTPDLWRSVIETNLSSAFYLSRAAWPTFRSQRNGVVINISSESARDPFPGLAAYASAKAGLNTLGITLAEEGQPIGVRVYTIGLGAVETPMLRGVISKEHLPTEQTLSPEEVAHQLKDCISGQTPHQSGDVIWIRK